MQNKVILISIDGMRPDGLVACGNPYVKELMQKGSYTLTAQTVFPSVTLPCHMSMFHSVTPERHGTTTNAYVPQVRPIDGLLEQIARAGGKSGVFFGWEPIRDLGRPGMLQTAEYVNAYAFDRTDGILADRALDYIEKADPDFVFLYMVETDEKGGHDVGWMSDTYLDCISYAIDQVKKVVDACGDRYTVIVTADHGGHDRGHGLDIPEDMTIPMAFLGKAFEAGKELKNVSILDLAPTIATIMGVPIPREWEGKVLVKGE
ncbi:MAG: alkaline phosphatase family protein [Clostridia bacterium]|nr:alkaline phosphatase family protein [Clostridia bacterium]